MTTQIKNGHAKHYPRSHSRNNSHRVHSGAAHTSHAASTTRSARRKANKIKSALDLLNEAAKEKKEELYEAIEHQYTDIRDAFDEVAATGKAVIKQAQRTANVAVKVGQKSVKKTAQNVDEKVHDNAWVMMGVAGLVGILLGYNASKKFQG
jgi:ElaB/YqjD/DUF883 family membrane-anchored ribosome-binding protein